MTPHCIPQISKMLILLISGHFTACLQKITLNYTRLAVCDSELTKITLNTKTRSETRMNQNLRLKMQVNP
jgi:hypothetical protein